jgi:hypothetical protein
MASKSADLKSAKRTIRFLEYSGGIVSILKAVWAFLFVGVAIYCFLFLPKEVSLGNRFLLVAAIILVGFVVFRYLYYLAARCNVAITWVRLAHDYWEKPRSDG